jgi:hypothetical protein
MANRRVFNLAVASCNGPYDYLARVDSNPGLKRQFALDPQPIRVAPYFFLQAERGIQRPLRMILVRDRRAEQRKNAVAGGLHDVATVTPHGLDHKLQCRINDRACFLGVEVLH